MITCLLSACAVPQPALRCHADAEALARNGQPVLATGELSLQAVRLVCALVLVHVLARAFISRLCVLPLNLPVKLHDAWMMSALCGHGRQPAVRTSDSFNCAQARWSLPGCLTTLRGCGR